MVSYLFDFKGKLRKHTNIPDGIRGMQIKLSQKYGSMHRLWFGNQLWISLSDPEDLEVRSSVCSKGKVFYS